jgi:hypothetical protein
VSIHWRTSRSDDITPVASETDASRWCLGCYRSPKPSVCFTQVATRPTGNGNTARSDEPTKGVFTASTAHGCKTHVPWPADACALSRPVVRRSEHSRAELARLSTRPRRVAEADPIRDAANMNHIPPTEARSDAAEEQAHPAGPRAFPYDTHASKPAASVSTRNHRAPRRARPTSMTQQPFAVRQRKRRRSSVALFHAPVGTAACSANRSSAKRSVGPTGGRAQSPSVICNVAVAAPQQERDHTSHEVSAPFGEISAAIVHVPVCLTDTVRSQGFSPSQRFVPAGASWLCFTPLPPLGFMGLQSFFRSNQP